MASDMVVKFNEATEYGSPAGKLCDAEIHFTAGVLAGMKLIGFSVWERRSPNGSRQVTFPARTYSVNGERRSFALLRPTDGTPEAQDRIKEEILTAWAEHEARAAVQA